MKRLKIIGLVLLVVLVGLQFFPTEANHSTTIPSTDFVKTYKAPEDIAQTHILHAIIAIAITLIIRGTARCNPLDGFWKTI